MCISNELLVERIKAGEEKYIPDLWLKVRKFITLEAKKQLSNYPEHYQGSEAGLENDMVNEAFFAFIKAVNDYNPAKGKFITYLGYKIKPSFNRVLYGYTDSKKLLNNAVSLDVPVNEEENIYFSDTVKDPAADKEVLELEAIGRRLAVHELLESALDGIDNPLGVDIILQMYNNNCNFPEAVRQLYGVKYPESRHKTAYMKLLRDIRKRLRLKRFTEKAEYWGIDEYISFTGSGLSAFTSHGFTSIVESDVIKKISKEEWFFNKVCG